MIAWSLAFLKHADDPLFIETLPLHGSSSFSNSKVEEPRSQWPGYRGEGHVDYLADTLRAILDGHPKSRIEDLMPWRRAKPSTLAA
jgi:hypothetical protein